MNKFLNNILFFAMASVAFWSCEKDEVRAILREGSAPVLSATQPVLLLNSANADDTVQVFSWNASDFGYQAAVKYTLQFDKAGNDFAEPREVVVAGLEKKYTTAEFNQMAILLGLAPDTEGTIEARVKAEVAPGVDPVYSAPVTLKATPYLVVINYPSMYVPGDYQGWNPGAAPKISSKKSNNDYEGYIYFGSGSGEFKITSERDWNHTNYGDAGGGKLSTDGGNLKVPTTGYYRLKANTTGMTWSAVKTDWGLVGSATGSWDVDKDMTYNEATGTWTLTTDLVAGDIKFRANDGWDINLGDDGGDKNMEYGGGNIPIAEAGNYSIVLDLSIPGNYTYTVVKN